jgi:hypothetical protein
VLPPESGLRQWVLTFPFSWRRRLAQDGGLLGRLTRIAVETVLAFYADRAAQEGGLGAKSGAVTAVQRTSSDLRLNPHLHMIALDGTWCERTAGPSQDSPGSPSITCRRRTGRSPGCQRAALWTTR